MIIMEPLSQGTKTNKGTLGRIDVLIIGLVAKEVGHAIDTPSRVQKNDISHTGADKEGEEVTLSPEVPGNQSREDEPKQQNTSFIIPAKRENTDT